MSHSTLFISYKRLLLRFEGDVLGWRASPFPSLPVLSGLLWPLELCSPTNPVWSNKTKLSWPTVDRRSFACALRLHFFPRLWKLIMNLLLLISSLPNRPLHLLCNHPTGTSKMSLYSVMTLRTKTLQHSWMGKMSIRCGLNGSRNLMDREI